MIGHAFSKLGDPTGRVLCAQSLGQSRLLFVTPAFLRSLPERPVPTHVCLLRDNVALTARHARAFTSACLPRQRPYTISIHPKRSRSAKSVSLTDLTRWFLTQSDSQSSVNMD
ncbi:hypothetical protein AOLI_G00189370 [Acnodon oligacanthus]